MKEIVYMVLAIIIILALSVYAYLLYYQVKKKWSAKRE